MSAYFIMLYYQKREREEVCVINNNCCRIYHSAVLVIFWKMQKIYIAKWTDNERFRRLVLISPINGAYYLPQSCRKSRIKCALCHTQKLNYIAAYVFSFFILLEFPEEYLPIRVTGNHFFEYYSREFHKENKLLRF